MADYSIELTDQFRPGIIKRFFRSLGAGIVIGAVVVSSIAAGSIVTGNFPPIIPSGGETVACSSTNYWDSGANQMAWHPDDCEFGTTITVTNATYSCTQNVATIAAQNGGTPPVRIINTWTQPSGVGTNGVTFDNGCSGDGTPLVDFIIYVTPSGPTGAVSDPTKLRGQPGPQNLDITGVINCASPEVLTPMPGDHQDGMQFQGGREVSLINYLVGGNYDTGVSNCQGAGGTAFYSGGGGSGLHLTHILGGEYVACNHALGIDDLGSPMAGSTVTHARFRNAFTNGSDYCSNFNLTDTCNVTPGGELVVFTDTICQRWNGSTWVDDTP